jgi:serine/threonine protein kinase
MKGNILFGYRLVDELATVSIGTLYRADSTSGIGGKRLIHLIEKKYFLSEVVASRYRNCAEQLTSLRHPNILDCLAYHESGEYHLLVFDDPGLVSMEEYLADKPSLSKERAAILISELADALNHANKRNLTHLHLKPKYIYYDTSSEKLRILGFCFNMNTWAGILAGLPVEELTGDVLSAASANEGSDDVLFLNYVSPEQLEAVTPDWKSDMYALGVLLFRLRMGRLPYPDVSSYEEYGQLLMSVPMSDRLNIIGELSDTEKYVISKATATKPKNRFGSYDEFIGSLAPAPTRVSVPSPVENIVSRPIEVAVESQIETSGKSPRSLGKIVGLVSVAVLLLAAVFLYGPIRDHLRWRSAGFMHCFIPSLRMRTDTTTYSDYNILPISIGEGDRIQILRVPGFEPWALAKIDDKTGYVNTEYLMTENDYRIMSAVIDSRLKQSDLKLGRYRRSIVDHVRKKVESNGLFDGNKLRGIQLEYISPGQFSQKDSNNSLGIDYLITLLHESSSRDYEYEIAVFIYKDGKEFDTKSFDATSEYVNELIDDYLSTFGFESGR